MIHRTAMEETHHLRIELKTDEVRAITWAARAQREVSRPQYRHLE
jgi:hypothetical protein